jgi:4'-phosphopantetheinyl transferase
MATAARGPARGSEDDPPQGLSEEVHLWLDEVDAHRAIDTLTEQLDGAEMARAGRFRFERDRTRFVARRAFLRTVLARYIGVAPAKIRYRVSPKGRPELESAFGISFSASHSFGLAVVAVARDRLVGVDLERIRPIPDVLGLAAGVCSPSERAHLRSMSQASRAEAFLSLWTRKEAYAKAIGQGLSMPFDQIDMRHRNDGPRHLMASGEPFVVAGLDGLDGYVGTVAASGSRMSVRHVHATAVPS